MRGPTLPRAPMKTHGPISVDLREKFLYLLFSFLSISPLTPSALPFFFLHFSPFCFSYFLFFSFIIFFSFLFFFFFSSCFIFPIICSTSQLAQCEQFTQVHHMSCHVSPNTRYLEKREIPIVLEYDEIQR